LFAIAAAFVLGITGIEAQQAFADLIDFETGFADLDSVTDVITATNVVTFGVGSCDDQGPAFIAETGDPRTAYLPTDDIPAGASGGLFFLTDEIAGPGAKLNYCISFATPVINLSLDLYDYRADGASVGGVATLSGFDAGGNLVDSATFVILGGEPDPNLGTLSITSPTSLISSAELSFSVSDGGTGIDNIRFTTNIVPLTFAEVYKVSGVSVIKAGTGVGSLVQLRCLEGDTFIDGERNTVFSLDPSMSFPVRRGDFTQVSESVPNIAGNAARVIGADVRAIQNGGIPTFDVPVTITGLCLSPSP